MCNYVCNFQEVLLFNRGQNNHLIEYFYIFLLSSTYDILLFIRLLWIFRFNANNAKQYNLIASKYTEMQEIWDRQRIFLSAVLPLKSENILSYLTTSSKVKKSIKSYGNLIEIRTSIRSPVFDMTGMEVLISIRLNRMVAFIVANTAPKQSSPTRI